MATQIQIANLSSFLASVEEAKKKVADLSTPLRKIGLDWMRTNSLIFTQGAGGSWADLNSRGRGVKVRGFGPKKTGEDSGRAGGYKLQKLRRWGFVYPILVASGRLKRSMTVPGDSDSLFDILNKSTLILGTRVASKDGTNYPFILHHGSKYFPARPFMTVSQLSVSRWKSILKAFVAQAANSTGDRRAVR